MRAPSSSIQHSSTPGLDPGKSAVETSRSAGITVKSSRSEDNSFPTARFYLSEHRLCSLHLGSLGSPFVIWERLCVVIPSEADGLRSEPSAKSKSLPRAKPRGPLTARVTTSLARHFDPHFLVRRPVPASRRLPLLPQQLLQHPYPLIHMLLLQQVRRQEPHHRILRAVEQHALRQRRIHNRPRRNLQIDPLNKSSPPHFLRGRALLGNRLQLLLQIGANFVHVVQQLLFFHDRQKLQRDAASQRTASESCPVLPRRG